MERSTFVIDVDHTICVAEKHPENSSAYDYVNARPIIPVIERIRQLKSDGHSIILFTARGMRTYKGDIDLIEANVGPVLLEWLKKHDVPFDELVMGKPWGPNVYYVDDRNLSPIEFAHGNPENYKNYIQL